MKVLQRSPPMNARGKSLPCSPRLSAAMLILIARARKEGATDTEIHDTVLIAAAFCMYNRYVDGLATWAPQ